MDKSFLVWLSYLIRYFDSESSVAYPDVCVWAFLGVPLWSDVLAIGGYSCVGLVSFDGILTSFSEPIFVFRGFGVFFGIHFGFRGVGSIVIVDNDVERVYDIVESFMSRDE